MIAAKLRKALDWLAYAAARNICAAAVALPWHVGRAVGRLSGHLAYVLDRRSRKQNAVRNIVRAMPGLNRAQARRLVREVYCHLGEALLDALQFARRLEGRSCNGLVHTSGFAQLDGRTRKTGIIFVTGHYGHWEILGAAAQRLGYPVWSIRRGFDNVYLDRYVARLRERTGQHVLGKHGFLRHMVRLVESGRNVGLLVDQDARRHGIFVDFFGRPASTTTAAARVAVRTGAPVAFVRARRLGRQDNFQVAVDDVIHPRPDADPRAEVRRITERMTRDLEEAVRETPEQWLWLHRRWKTYPGKYSRR
ncbi:MAG: lysophospholipid acyltransferase family protein [Candidatus Brocadiia bacterium]